MGMQHEHGHRHPADSVPPSNDPVCGMTVSPAEAAGKALYEGREYYFCSDGCRKKFEQEPRRYVAASSHQHGGGAAPSHHHGQQRSYTCPMHPEVVQDGPGTCPKCGMALEPLPPAAPASGKTEYTKALLHGRR